MAASDSLEPLEGTNWGSGRLRLSATLVVVAAPVRVDLAKSALDDGRVGLGKSILEGGRALDVARARPCGGAKDISFVLSVRLDLVVLVWGWDRAGSGLGASASFLELSATEGGLEGTFELELEGTTGGIFVAARLLGLSGTELVLVGTLGFGGGTSLGRGAGTIVILLGPVCILGTPPCTGMIPGWTRVMPPPRGWFTIRLGPGRAATCTRVWDIELILVDVVESALLVML